MHEYGHYISDLLNLTALPGGNHTANCYDYNINEGTPISKSHALQLAFSEGVATYFAKAAQYYFKEEAVNWEPGFADYSEYVTYGDVGYGEMGEDTTTCVLSALCGFKQDYVSLGLGDKKTLELLKEFVSGSYGNTSAKKTFPQFIKLLYSKEYISKEALGFILTECEAAPLIQSVSKSGNTFNIKFVANGGSQSVRNNEFDFVLYNGYGDEIYNGMPMAMFDSRFQRIAYYAQEMNAGKGYYTNWLEFGTSDPESRTYIALSVSSFSGYFDSASPLTDLYIGFGAFGARSRAFMRSHEKYASLVIVSQETDENWNVISETNRTALEFSTADKRNCGTGFTGHGMRMHEQRNVVTEADFTGDMGCLLFKLELEDVEGWDAIRECRVYGSIIMRYKKINGKIYIGGRNETFDTIA